MAFHHVQGNIYHGCPPCPLFLQKYGQLSSWKNRAKWAKSKNEENEKKAQNEENEQKVQNEENEPNFQNELNEPNNSCLIFEVRNEKNEQSYLSKTDKGSPYNVHNLLHGWSFHCLSHLMILDQSCSYISIP